MSKRSRFKRWLGLMGLDGKAPGKYLVWALLMAGLAGDAMSRGSLWFAFPAIILAASSLQAYWVTGGELKETQDGEEEADAG